MFSQSITNIHLDDMFTNGLREVKEYNKSLRKVIVKYIIAILLRSTSVDNNEIMSTQDLRCIMVLNKKI